MQRHVNQLEPRITIGYRIGTKAKVLELEQWIKDDHPGNYFLCWWIFTRVGNTHSTSRFVLVSIMGSF